ncbi:two-component regulator propeller domain-containing protein [Mucilaginibacter sabulilitoris]|uniref:histidine kinase n=1 Tax=Mucilaginibacter sabulilitoris TaxID=1173583 RepID=A0ABZ0TSU9_9SPHI|nr:two-component regulator propeller domain-containing protein [Mucilaginibacter sabulilitoris]WPU95228.1 two-component regulator propeller domain-containing protein [Mucilaginibacter sabulilitoris]
MLKYRFFSVFFFCLIATGNIFGQSYYFSHYQVENGLSNNAVICSIQDKKGFMWFGTKDGLNRFDGYTYKIFRNNPDDKNSIGSNFICSLYQDQNGVLWIGTERGLYTYDDHTESFKFLKGSSTNAIRGMVMDGGQNLWFISGLTLFKYIPATGVITSYARDFEATSLCSTAGGAIWAATPQGTLQRYDEKSDSFLSYPVFNHSKPATSDWIEKIYSDAPGSLLVGTSNQGVKMFNTRTLDYTDLLTNNTDGTTIFVRDFIRSSSNEIWIATESGIFIYDETSHKFTNLHKQYNNSYSLSDNAVYTLCNDREGGIWAGTYFGGVNYYPKRYTYFEKTFPKTGENSISGNAVREIRQDDQGNLWIGTEDAGLNKLDRITGLFSNYKPGDRKSGIANTNIHGLLISGNELWIGTFEHGLDVMDLKTEKIIRHYNAGPSPNQFKSNFIYCMLKTRKDEILIGTAVGMYKYNKATNDFTLLTQIPVTAFYTTITEDKVGTIWAGTFRDGVHYFNEEKNFHGTINKFPDKKINLSANRITCVLEDTGSHIWIATESGLYKYNPLTKHIKEFSVKTGFPVNLIYSVLEDSNKQLWISTSKGLLNFDIGTEKVKVFTRSNGLLNDQFNYNSAFKDSAGKMYFGSVKGLISFKPAEFITNTFIPPVYITGFQVSNLELAVNKDGSPLKKSIILTDHITLTHHQSSFSIDFSALNYTSPGTTEYAYKMNGLYEQWTYIKTNRKAYFTELPPGDYVFRVKAANSSGVWNTKETRLYIKVLPPYWKSTWAYTIYALLFIVFLWWIVNSYHKRLQAKNDRKMEVFENEKEKEIYQAKIEFFTNVAHEIRTPLTLIKGPMEKVIKRAHEVPDIEKNLQIMDKHTERLLSLTTQLLDFRKTESNGFSLNFVKVNITTLLNEVWTGFQSAAEQKNIDYQLLTPPKPLFAYIDPEALTKVISNLIDNAIKYGRSVIITELLPHHKNDGFFSIQVRNNGRLIPAEFQEKIFEPFFRLKGNEKKPGTGIGLSLSRALVELHKGRLQMIEPADGFNIFVITLPVHQLIEFKLNGKWKKQ